MKKKTMILQLALAASLLFSTVAHARWLKANVKQDMNVMILDSNQEGAMYVVGTLGQNVSESATFNVTPTFVVSRTSITEN